MTTGPTDHDRLLHADALRADLPATPLPASTVRAGSPTTGALTFDRLGPTEVGLWEMSEGSATDVEVDEVFVILTGGGTVRFDDGEVIELAPGVVVRLRAGERTLWTVTEPLRKLYVAM